MNNEGTEEEYFYIGADDDRCSVSIKNNECDCNEEEGYRAYKLSDD